eukprot:412733_1
MVQRTSPSITSNFTSDTPSEASSLSISESSQPESPQFVLPPNPNKNLKGYVIRNGKMVGIKIKKCDNILLIRNRFQHHNPTITVDYLNACQLPKRTETLPIESFIPAQGYNHKKK